MENDYQATLSVFIFLLCLNLVFWIIIACYRFCSLITLTRTFSFRRLVNQFQNFRYYLQRRFFRRRVTRITNLNNLNGISNRNLDLNSDLPPTYEEALKFPCVSTVCSNVMMNNNATILNLATGSISDLDNLNLLGQLEGQRQSILLCTGNCNCINHLRQSMQTNHDHHNVNSSQLPESSSTATTSTLNSSTVNTFTTTIDDERPIGANRNLIVETNFTSFSNRPNFYGEPDYDNPSLVIDDESNKEPQIDHTADLEQGTTNLQSINADLELNRNDSVHQLNRSSTFNDLQSYLRNYLQNR